MKYIKSYNTFINEAVGVPNGLLNIANIIYDIIIYNKLSTYLNGTSKYHTSFFIPINNSINDMYIEDIHIEFEFIKGTKNDNYSAHMFKEDLNKFPPEFTVYFVIPIEEETYNILNKCDENQISNNISNYFKYSYPIKLKTTLTHELKHIYDFYKNKNTQKTKDMHHGDIPKDINPIYPMYKFLYDLYYMSHTENLAKHTEIASSIDRFGIAKSRFPDYLTKDTDMYIYAQKIKNMTYTSFITDLEKYKEEIKTYLHKVIPHNNRIDVEPIFELLCYCQSYIERIRKYRFSLKPNKKYDCEPELFFKNEIKHMNISADKFMKKLAKLYTVAK